MSENSKKIGEYVIDPIKIGVGSFASVFRGKSASGRDVAIKIVSKEKLNMKKLQENLDNEIEIMRSLKHPNIVEFIEILKSERKHYIIMEYCAGGDLSQYIRQRGKLDEALAHHFMMQLSKGLLFLYQNNLVHRDLKPQNLLILDNTVAFPQLKLADFGFARSLKPQSLANTLCGSPLYMVCLLL